jgi:hypothetical protein
MIAIQGYQRSGTAMLLKFRLEMDVMIDQDPETAVIELARRHYKSEGGITVPGRRGKPTRVSAERFIEGTDQALLELLGHHSLLREAGIEVERLSCRAITSSTEMNHHFRPSHGVYRQVATSHRSVPKVSLRW